MKTLVGIFTSQADAAVAYRDLRLFEARERSCCVALRGAARS